MGPSNISIDPELPRTEEDLPPPVFDEGRGIDLPKKLPLLQQMFSFPAMLAVLLVGAVFVSGRKFLVDPDLWWHIKSATQY